MTGEMSARDEVIEITRRLLRFDTTTTPGNEEPAARYLGEYLAEAGAETTLQQVAVNRSNLIARVRGSGATGHLVFSGHLDVVPAGERDQWRHDPFGAEIEGAKLFGRGSADMKGGVAAMATAMARIARGGGKPQADLILVASVGEELGMTGARLVASSGVLEGCAHLVIGEPTGLDICRGQKGAMFWQVTIDGQAAHSSTPELGVNAINVCARFVSRLERNPLKFERSALLGDSTVSVTMVNGGTSRNVIPGTCTAVLNTRLVPGQTRESVAAELRASLAEAIRECGMDASGKVEFIVGGDAIETPADHPLVQTLGDAIQQVRGQEARVVGFTGATEAVLLCPAYGVPMVIFGPGYLEHAHTTDEYVEIDQLATAASVYERVARTLLAV